MTDPLRIQFAQNRKLAAMKIRAGLLRCEGSGLAPDNSQMYAFGPLLTAQTSAYDPI